MQKEVVKMEFSVSLAKLVNDLGLEVVYTPCDVDKIKILSLIHISEPTRPY